MEMTASGILSRTLAAVKDRFGALLGLWGVYFAAQIAMFVVFGAVIGFGGMAGAGLDPSAGGAAAMGVGFILLLILFYVVYLLLYAASYGSMAHMASPLHRPDFGQSFSAGVRASLPLLGAMLLLLIGYFVISIPISLVFGLLAMAGSEVVTGLIAILLLPLLIYLGCRLSLLFPLATVEGIRSPVTLIMRSWSLTSGHVMAIFLATLLFAVVALVLLMLVFLPVFMPLMSGNLAGAEPGIGAIVLLVVGGAVAGVVLSIMGAALGAVIHAGVSDRSGENYSETFG